MTMTPVSLPLHQAISRVDVVAASVRLCPAMAGPWATGSKQKKRRERENLMFLSLRVAAAARFKERMREHKRYGRVEKERAHKAGTRLTTGLSLLIGAFTKERFISLFSFSSLYLLLRPLIPTDKLGF